MQKSFHSLCYWYKVLFLNHNLEQDEETIAFGSLKSAVLICLDENENKFYETI